MTLSQEPPPAPGLRSRPARRWAAGAPRSRAGATGGGGGGHKGHLASAGDTQVSGQLLGPCSGCWWGAELWGQREHRWRPTAPPGLLAAGGGTGQSCARNWVQRAQWVLGQTTRSSSRGGVRATRAAAGGGGGACVAQRSWRRLLRKGLDHTLPLPHRTAASNPKTAPNHGSLGAAPG